MGKIEKVHKGHNVTINTIPGRAEFQGKWVYDLRIGTDEGRAYTEKSFHSTKAYDTEDEAIRQAALFAMDHIDKGEV